MKRKEIIALYNGLQNLKDLKGVKLSYATVRNTKALEAEIIALQEVIRPRKEFQEYDKARIELCEKYCSKDSDGKPIKENNVYVGLEDCEEFNDELKNLREKYNSCIEERNKQLQEYNELLEEEVEIKIHTIRLEDVPEDVTVSQMAILEKFIEEK